MTTDFVMRHDIIFREDTNVSGMVRNHKIARALQDAALGEVNRQIDYKCEFYGKKCIKTGRFFASSKICNHCGQKNDDLKLSDRVWVCPHCGQVVARDYNASRNILEDGINILREQLGERYIVTHICVLRTQTDDKCSQVNLGEVGSSSPNLSGIIQRKDCGESVRHRRVRQTAQGSEITRSSKREETDVSSDSLSCIEHTEQPISVKSFNN